MVRYYGKSKAIVGLRPRKPVREYLAARGVAALVTTPTGGAHCRAPLEAGKGGT